MTFTKQRIYRSGAASGSQARRLIAAIVPGDAVLRHTIADQAGLGVTSRTHGTISYFIIESPNFAGRYYTLRRLAGGGWQCSGDERAKAYCIAQVEATQASVALVA